LEVITNAIKIVTNMNIYGADGTTLIGYSVKSEAFDTSFTISDVNGNVVSASLLTWGESWRGAICKVSISK